MKIENKYIYRNPNTLFMNGAKIIMLVVFMFFINQSDAQNKRKIDSLEKEIAHDKEDTTKVISLNWLSWEYRSNDRFKSLKAANEAKAIALKIKFDDGYAFSLLNLGLIKYVTAEYDSALYYHKQSIAIYEKRKDKKGIGANLNNIGLIYEKTGKFDEAVNSYLKVQRINFELGDKAAEARTLNNISNVYKAKKDYESAIRYNDMALKIREEIHDSIGLARSLNSRGILLYKSKKYDEAIGVYRRGLKIMRLQNDSNGMAMLLGNMANALRETGQTAEALVTLETSYKIFVSLGDRHSECITLINLGDEYAQRGNFKKSEELLFQGVSLAKKINEPNTLNLIYEALAETYRMQKNYEKALEYYMLHTVLNDSLFTVENSNQINALQVQFDTEKKDKEILKQDAAIKQGLAETRQRETERNAFVSGFILVLGLAFFIFRSYKQKKNANIIITQQKEEVENQKHIIEEKNKDILDSITYAKRLQDAILPRKQMINRELPDSFLLYKPKDIVAGDFYFMEKRKDKIIIAVADCTGHGVPGAMVSVVCSNALSRAVKEFGLIEPGKILDKVTELVVETFEKSESDVNDGMDISIAVIDKKEKKIQWSGAHNPLWYLENGVMKEISADKQPIGKFDQKKPFTTHTLNCESISSIYLFTDGFADQFGGPQGKKFKYKPMKELLASISAELPVEQLSRLDSAFKNWKGKLEQVDDVCVMGIKL